MKAHHWLVLALVLAAVIAVAFALRPLADGVGERIAPPLSAADLLRERRETTPPSSDSSWLMLAAVLLGAFLLAFARAGAEFLKQWRLARRPRRRARQRPMTMTTLPELPQVDELPPWRDS